VAKVVEQIAAIRGVSAETIAAATDSNFTRLFGP
jgi:Tat protein secretion system quality control protein TatD with DNase activity